MTTVATAIHQDERAALIMADALAALVAVIDRELNANASEGVAPTDPAWADAISIVLRAAESCGAALDEPHVLAVLERASSAAH